MGYDPNAYVSEAGNVAPDEQHLPPIASQQQQRVDAAFAEVQQHAVQAKRELDLMTQARVRFAKAALYEQIIEGQLFEGDDPVTIEVENEFKDFAEQQLMVLLGMQAEKGKAAGQLEEEEVTVLKLFAAKLLGRPANIPRPEAPAAPALKPRMAVAPTPQQGQLAAPKRGRGRPPGTGKNQRAAQAAMEQQRIAQYQPPAPQMMEPQQRVAPQPPPAPPAFLAPQGATRMVEMPDGSKKEVSVQAGQVRPVTGPKPLPMPSPAEMVTIAAAHGEAAHRAIDNSFRNGGEMAPIIPVNLNQ